MKKTFQFLAGFTLLFSTLSAQVQWSEPIEISGGECPDFAIDRKTGNLHIVTMVNGVTYTLVDSAGNILHQRVVPGAKYDRGRANSGATIAVDQEGYPHVCFRTIPSKNHYSLYYTRQHASGWTDKLMISESVPWGYIVRMAIDGQNRIHVVQSNVPQNMKEPFAEITYYRIFEDKLEKYQKGIKPFRVDNTLEIDVTKDGTAHLILGNPDPVQGEISYFRSSKGYPMNLIKDIHSKDCIDRNGSPDVFVDLSGNMHFCYGSCKDQSVGRNRPSIRYVRIEGDIQRIDMPVTPPLELESWNYGEGWGLGSVAASDDGKYVAIAYLTKDEGNLKVIISSDGGNTWSAPKKLASPVGGFLGRSKHVIRAYKNNFYVLYPIYYKFYMYRRVELRILRGMGCVAPTASAGGPYAGQEGDSILFDGSASSDEGPYQGIIEYAWDWQNDGVFDSFSSSSTTEHKYLDNIEGEAVLRVTDRDGMLDYDTTSIHITNVEPSVDIGDTLSCNEGDTLRLSCEVKDPGTLDTHTFLWDFGDSLLGVGQEVDHIYQDEGQYTAVVTVKDDDEGIDTDTLKVFVSNVKPSADAGGPYYGIVGDTITFIGSAYDPGKHDILTYTWDLNGDGVFESSGQIVTGSFGDMGDFTVWLRVEDEDEGVGLDSALVTTSNQAPIISLVPDQTIDEGGLFNPIYLDEYVEDLDHSNDQLNWRTYGNNNLLVTLENRILAVAVPDSEWSGQETLTLIVTDPGRLEDSTEITFTVNPVNDPPRLNDVPDYTFNEDDTLEIPLSDLWLLVSDVDDDTTDFRFWITGNTFIHGFEDSINGIFCLLAEANWYGNEKVVFVVSDKAGLTDKDTSTVTVESLDDPLDPFSLISPMVLDTTAWPDTIKFVWHQVLDPDSGNIVDYVSYELILQLEGSMNSNFKSVPVPDTICQFIPADHDLGYGKYLWWVKANSVGQTIESKESENIGIITIVDTTTSVAHTERLPTEFRLLQNYPNPFNPETWITYYLPKVSQIRLAIYNTLGREIKLLDKGKKMGGVYTIVWNGRDYSGQRVPSGIYICKFEAESRVFYRKMMLIQ